MQAKLRHLRISPRKVRLIADMIRGKTVLEANRILNFTVKKAKIPILKLLNSAIANSKNKKGDLIDSNNLYVAEIKIDKAPTLKRQMPRSKGRAFSIYKRKSHVIIKLGTKSNIKNQISKTQTKN